MGQSKLKLLVETSAVLPAIGFSNSDHNAHFESTATGAELYTSLYIRMELLRKWVCEAVEFAELAEQCSTVSNAFNFWAQQYGRKPKIAVDLAGWLIRDKKLIDDSDTHQFAIEVAQKAWELLRGFDLTFISRTNNTCGCEIGGWNLNVDHRQLLKDLGDFRREFLVDVVDCKVNSFLQLGSDKGRVFKLLACDAVANDAKIRDPLKAVVVDGDVTCSNCKTIGDQIIAMEQPKGVTLLHVDKSYDKLCNCTRRPHVKFRSAASFKPKLPPPAPADR